MLDECTYVKSGHYSPYLRGVRRGKVRVSAFITGVKPVHSWMPLFKSEHNEEHIEKRNKQK